MHLSDLTTDEAIELLHCRLMTIESLMTSAFEGFKHDLIACVESELESAGANPAQKTKIMTKMTGVADKHPARRKK